MAKWDNAIVDRGTVDPMTLVANPANFRIHPDKQQKAMTEVLDEIGWIEDVIVNKNTGNLVDGHLRVGLAIAKGENVPVAYVELTEEQEKAALATLDTITTMAVKDDAALYGLLDDIGSKTVDWMREAGVATPQPNQQQIEDAAAGLEGKFRQDGKNAGVEVECPMCHMSFGLAGTGITS